MEKNTKKLFIHKIQSNKKNRKQNKTKEIKETHFSTNFSYQMKEERALIFIKHQTIALLYK